MESELEKLAVVGNLGHAYIFYGEDADFCLKTAKKLASFLENGTFSDPKVFLEEFLFIEPIEKESIGIDEIRGLQKFFYQRPGAGKKRMAVISPAESLTSEAQSSILKIAEEPPEDSLLVLIARHPDNLLPTVSSRFQKIYLKSAESGKRPSFASTSAKAMADKKASEGKKEERKKEDKNGDEVDEYFKKTLTQLKKDPKKNYAVLKEVLKRYSLIKRYNLNKKLQLKYLEAVLKKNK